jgi:uncharacterized protein (TIGR02300 family)
MTQPLRRVSNSAVYHGLWRGVIRLFLAANRTASTIDSRLATSQVKHPNCGKDRTVAKPELGTKRLCASCGAKFYDLNSKDPIHCPKCGAVYEVVAVATRPTRPEPMAPVAAAAPRPPVPAEEVAAPEPQEAETVSLEEADAEAQGATAKKPAATEPAEAEEEEVEMDESIDDNTFIEEQEEEDADVTDIIGGDIENEEEG